MVLPTLKGRRFRVKEKISSAEFNKVLIKRCRFVCCRTRKQNLTRYSFKALMNSSYFLLVLHEGSMFECRIQFSLQSITARIMIRLKRLIVFSHRSAGHCLFAYRRWLDPADPADFALLHAGYGALCAAFPPFAACPRSLFLERLAHVASAWSAVQRQPLVITGASGLANFGQTPLSLPITPILLITPPKADRSSAIGTQDCEKLRSVFLDDASSSLTCGSVRVHSAGPPEGLPGPSDCAVAISIPSLLNPGPALDCAANGEYACS
jgi:hypothetical protein